MGPTGIVIWSRVRLTRHQQHHFSHHSRHFVCYYYSYRSIVRSIRTTPPLLPSPPRASPHAMAKPPLLYSLVGWRVIILPSLFIPSPPPRQTTHGWLHHASSLSCRGGGGGGGAACDEEGAYLRPDDAQVEVVVEAPHLRVVPRELDLELVSKAECGKTKE